MARSILAVVLGFVLWTILWLAGSVAVNAGFGLDPEAEYFGDPAPLATLVVVSVACSLVAGFACGRISRLGLALPAAVLAVTLLAVGLAVELAFWATLPVWYHLVFLVLLMPATLGGAGAAGRKAHVPAAG